MGARARKSVWSLAACIGLVGGFVGLQACASPSVDDAEELGVASMATGVPPSSPLCSDLSDACSQSGAMSILATLGAMRTGVPIMDSPSLAPGTIIKPTLGELGSVIDATCGNLHASKVRTELLALGTAALAGDLNFPDKSYVDCGGITYHEVTAVTQAGKNALSNLVNKISSVDLGASDRIWLLAHNYHMQASAVANVPKIYMDPFAVRTTTSAIADATGETAAGTIVYATTRPTGGAETITTHSTCTFDSYSSAFPAALFPQTKVCYCGTVSGFGITYNVGTITRAGAYAMCVRAK